MTELIKLIETQKSILIEQLLTHGVFKTSDERHLYDVPLYVLEDEYRQVLSSNTE